MIPSPDAGFVYPKTGLDVDLRFETRPHFTSSGSMYLDGVDDYLDLDGLTLTTDGADYSFSFWFKSQDDTADHRFFDIRDSSSNHRCQIYCDATKLYYYSWNGSDPSATLVMDAAFVAGFEDGTWHHLAIVVSSGTGVVGYVDGQSLGASQTGIDLDLSSADNAAIGSAYGGDASTTLSGNIANFGVWHAALTQAQVRSLMTANTYAEAITKGGSTPRAYFLLESNATDSVGAITYTTSSSTSGTLTNGAVIVGDRARLPNGYDLSMTDGVPNQMNAQLFSGRAIALDGTGDYIDVDGMQWDSTGAWSVSWWTKMVGAAVANRKAWGFRSSSASDRWNFSICRSGNVNQFGAYNDDGSSTEEIGLGSNTLIFDGTWHHLVFTVTGGTSCRLYVDGLLVSADGETISQSADMSAADEGAIGAAYDGTGLLAMELADWKIVAGTAWSAAQVLEQYQNPEMILPTGVTTSHLKQWLPLSDYDISGANNLDGLYMQDASGSGKHGLMANGGATFSIPNIPQLGLRSSSSRLYFDQDDDKVTVGNNAAINGLFASGGTESFWIFPNSVGEGTWGRILDATTGHMAFLGSASGSACMLFFYHDWSTDGNWNTTSTDITLGAWNHIVITYDGSSDSNAPVIYVNDSSKAVTEGQSPAGSIGNDDADKIIGNKADGSRTFDGYISEVAMWKTVLDADAVTAIYNSGVQGFDLLSDSGNYDNAADVGGWWKLDNPVTIQDLTANDNDGTVSGTPNMVTVPEGTTEGLSVMGSLTQNRLGSAVMPMSIVADEDAGSSPGILAYAKGPTTSFDNTDFTVTMWVYLSNTPSDMRYFHWVPGTGYILLKLSSAGKHQCLIEGGTTNTSLEVNKDVRNAWSFVAFRKDAAADLKAYAGLVTEASLTTDTDTTNVGNFSGSAQWYLGSDNAAYRGLSGSIAMPRIWTDTALSDAQINALFNSGKRFLLGDS